MGPNQSIEVSDGPAKQALSARIFAIARPIGLDVERQNQSCSHHAGQNQVMSIADDSLVPMAMRAA
jgi:hypothetical protein